LLVTTSIKSISSYVSESKIHIFSFFLDLNILLPSFAKPYPSILSSYSKEPNISREFKSYIKPILFFQVSCKILLLIIVSPSPKN